jgi:hypothetical protein
VGKEALAVNSAQKEKSDIQTYAFLATAWSGWAIKVEALSLEIQPMKDRGRR